MITNSTEDALKLPSDQEASGRRLGSEELQQLKEVIESGILTSTKGEYVHEFEHRFAAILGIKHAFACSSGTAAIHSAVCAIDPEPGDEIVTSPITDMGALTPILYQSAVPVFADVDPRTCNLTAETIEACVSPRTRAIIVTHLFGNPCDMRSILELARTKGLPVIEDCAQAFLAEYDEQYVGTLGKIGCFSLQQGKHITTGEGGIVVTDDDEIARRLFLFINKAWGYGDQSPDHYFLALNYRMTELQGAVARAQLQKIHAAVRDRVETAYMLGEKLNGIDGIQSYTRYAGAKPTYWKYPLRVDKRVVQGGSIALAAKLKQRNISCVPRYIQKPAFMCKVFQDQKTFGSSKFPFSVARSEALNYSPSAFPNTMAALEEILVLPWNENYTKDHVEYIAASIREAMGELR